MNFAHLTDTELRSYLAVHPDDTAAAAQAVHRFCNPRIELEKAHFELRGVADRIDRLRDTLMDFEGARDRLASYLDTE